MAGLLAVVSGMLLLALSRAGTAATAIEAEATDPCALPVPVDWIAREPEHPAADDWRTAGSGDRLREDACGHVWALWFNSFVVHEGGEAKRIGRLQLPYEGPLAALTRAGIADFHAGPGVLEVLGRNGEFARLDRSGWRLLPAPQPCRNGRLARAGASLWLSCEVAAGHLLARWQADAGNWRVERRDAGARPLLLNATAERVYAIGERAIARIDGDTLGDPAAQALPTIVNAAAIDARRLAIGGEAGLWLQDRASGAWHAHLPGRAVSGLAFDAHGTLWAAVRDDGVRALVGGEWLAWRFAQGLPEAEARDLLVDRQGRLWLGGTPSTVIDAAAAARRMRALAAPPAVAVAIHANACAAADALLATDVSADVARVRIEGVERVFFGSRQVCPDPWRADLTEALHVRRPADGAVLEIAHNGRRGYMVCGEPCVEPSRSRVAASWRMRIHPPNAAAAGVRGLPVPEPLPTVSPSSVAWLDARDNVWVATDEGTLYRHDGRDWHRHEAGSLLAADNRAMAIAEGADGSIWIGSSPTWSRERARYSGTPLHRWRHGRWRHLTVGADGHAWSVWDILPLADGALLAGNGGVRRVHLDGSDAADTPVLANGWVHAVASDRDGRRWALHGHGNPGLSVLVDGRWRRLSTREGLLADTWRALAFDASERAWLLADDGRVAVYRVDELLGRLGE